MIGVGHNFLIFIGYICVALRIDEEYSWGIKPESGFNSSAVYHKFFFKRFLDCGCILSIKPSTIRSAPSCNCAQISYMDLILIIVGKLSL